ncbi:hypothetical protein [Pseudoalteromonas luteoviolacea]|uniref:Uncharacterized protein n=2 Tax=Pseudoalteromonas luteoviolacea TaxID=43657 RepID=A0A167D9R3_9GAMM|nr:hypothetical protein [Pseudoalteromonas luteoviolacea]KZN48585.1 hypothetical protein N475_06035 [Pseudoalteromonas luteoviolacea DSM 6061]MBE0388713.1 hypothetical protein [Pseudoalteromonas luteoviolacea DSM 6061]
MELESKVTEILMKHDSDKSLPLDRLSLIKTRSSEFIRKLNQIIEKFPDVHQWYIENYHQDLSDT